MTLQVTIAEYSEDMLDDIIELFSKYYPQGNCLLDREYINWLYRDNPYGLSKIVSVVIEEKMAGFMALIPLWIGRSAERIKAFYVVNVLVDPAHAGKNLFLRMIGPVVEHAASIDAVLIGHPNDLAIRMWQRKKMHFQETMQPYLAVPNPLSRFRSRKILNRDELISLANTYSTEMNHTESWNIVCSGQFIVWKFLDNPVNKYSIYSLSRQGKFRGLQIVRKLRPGVNLLIDQLVPENDAAAAMGKLPLPTICFASPGDRDAVKAAIALPFKKRIAFFVTGHSADFAPDSTRKLGLTATDF